MNPAQRERASLAHDLAAIYIATQARRCVISDRLAGVAAIILAGLCGLGPLALVWLEMMPWQ